MDIRDADTAELRRLKTMIDSELDRRETLATASRKAAELNVDYLRAAGITEGDEWRQPRSAVDSYPKDWIAAHNGKTWTSLVDGNVWEPGASAWRELASDPDVAPEWIQPTGAHDAYSTGDRVTFEGAEYVSKIDGNTWSPTAYPAGWELVS